MLLQLEVMLSLKLHDDSSCWINVRKPKFRSSVLRFPPSPQQLQLDKIHGSGTVNTARCLLLTYRSDLTGNLMLDSGCQVLPVKQDWNQSWEDFHSRLRNLT